MSTSNKNLKVATLLKNINQFTRADVRKTGAIAAKEAAYLNLTTESLREKLIYKSQVMYSARLLRLCKLILLLNGGRYGKLISAIDAFLSTAD